ncbi:hypothetical protein EON63_13990 [archaeon]|nr:MAG: hypothetical protein EON63_13990 [archaeon]
MYVSQEPIHNYLVRLDQLESILGYRLLPAILSPSHTIPNPNTPNNSSTKAITPYTPHTQSQTPSPTPSHTSSSYTSPYHTHLDSFVPSHRDLTILLNAQTSMVYGDGNKGGVSMKDVGGMDVMTVPSYTLAQKTPYTPPSPAYKPSQTHTSKMVMHLCECIDCTKSMFPKKK